MAFRGMRTEETQNGVSGKVKNWPGRGTVAKLQLKVLVGSETAVLGKAGSRFERGLGQDGPSIVPCESVGQYGSSQGASGP